jgi:hypothetical protein
VHFRNPSIQLFVDSLYTLILRRRSLAKLKTGKDRRDVVVCSPGGVATTALMLHLGSFMEINHPSDSDGLKHLPNPRELRRDQKIVFVHGETQEIIESLRRRKYVLSHVLKLGGWRGMLVALRKSHWESFLAVQVENQKRLFLSMPSDQCFSVSYDRLWDSTGELADFLNLPDKFVADFPERRSRTNKSRGHLASD